MKLDALDHPKTLDFASRLEVELPTAIGHLELLWAFTGKKSPQGNVGKWPDGAISMACCWRGAPAKFVSALVDAGFLDASAEHRYLIHDWADHQPNWVRAKLAKLKLPVFRPDLSRNESPKNGHFVPTQVDLRTDSSGLENALKSTSVASSRARVLPSEAKGSVLRTHPESEQTPGPDPDQGAFEQELQGAFEQELQGAYPPVGGRGPNWLTAMHHARRLVETSYATWPELVAAAKRYATYCAAPGMEWYTVMSPVGFFSAVDLPWSQEWTPAAGKPDAKAMRLAAEAEQLEALKASRAELGIPEFPDPGEHESPGVYETKLKLAASEKRSASSTGGPRSIRALLAKSKQG